jgi:hypothetical protein
MFGTSSAQGVVRDACQYHRSALRRGVEFAVSICATVPKIFSDGVRVGQVLAPLRACCCETVFWGVLMPCAR